MPTPGRPPSMGVRAVAYAANANAISDVDTAIASYVADPMTALGADFVNRYNATSVSAVVDGSAAPPVRGAVLGK
eukprot:212197-Chlamydomonas_euryale.AAC.1